MLDNEISGNSLERRPNGSIDEFDEDNVPENEGELEDGSPLEGLLLLQSFLFLLSQDNLSLEVLDYESVNQVHGNRETTKNE